MVKYKNFTRAINVLVNKNQKSILGKMSKKFRVSESKIIRDLIDKAGLHFLGIEDKEVK